jgi:hypothetical protein
MSINCSEDDQSCISCKYRSILLAKLEIATFECKKEKEISAWYRDKYATPKDACAEAVLGGDHLIFFDRFFFDTTLRSPYFPRAFVSCGTCRPGVLIHEGMHLLGYEHKDPEMYPETRKCFSKLCQSDGQ